MKVVENTHDRLVLEHRPVQLSVMLAMAVLFFAAAGLGLIFDATVSGGLFVLACSLVVLTPFLLAGVERTRLSLDRAEGRAYFQRKTLLGWKGEWHDLNDLHCAEVEKQADRRGTYYRPAISFNPASKIDQIALVHLYAPPGYPQTAVDTINKWLDRPSEAVVPERLTPASPTRVSA